MSTPAPFFHVRTLKPKPRYAVRGMSGEIGWTVDAAAAEKFSASQARRIYHEASAHGLSVTREAAPSSEPTPCVS